jgi:putative inorganic carbon (HCO3(-)) transporter
MISEDSLTRDLKKIVLICFGGLGDVILFSPIVKVLRDLYPKSKITMVVEPRSRSVADKNPYIDKVLTFDLKNNPGLKDYMAFIKELRNENPDLAISMGRSFMVPVLLFLSGAKHRVGYATNKLKFLYSKSVTLNENQYAAKMYFDLLKGVGIDSDMLNPVPEFHISETEMKWANEWFDSKKIKDNPESKTVVIHPGASKLSKEKNIIKTWEPEKWAKLINNLLERDNVKVILAGGPDDQDDIKFISSQIKPNNNFINAYGETKSLEQLGALLKKSDLLICVDSSPMNVGVGVKIPIVALFGPTNDKKLVPSDKLFSVVRVHLECTPCLWDKRQTTCESLTCMKNIEMSSVLDVVFEKLNMDSGVKITP